MSCIIPPGSELEARQASVTPYRRVPMKRDERAYPEAAVTWLQWLVVTEQVPDCHPGFANG